MTLARSRPIKLISLGFAFLGLLILLASAGCARSDELEEKEALLLPSRAAFPPVFGVLERRCATLDCHGKPERNLRLYGGSGLRLDPADVPGSGSTTEAEYDVNYESVVALEPEVLSLVLREGGEGIERLTFIRKARGSESHKGGQMITAGDASDQCIASWLSSSVDEAICASAGDVTPPW